MSKSKHLNKTEPAIRKFLTKKDDMVNELCDHLIEVVPLLAEVNNYDKKLASFQRDLTYLSEAAENNAESALCFNICLYLNFSVMSDERPFEGEFDLNDLLLKRIRNLSECHERSIHIGAHDGDEKTGSAGHRTKH
ncbi:hypothetical protein [Microvirga sesbaniae]|uniref:hypothetical protein n=1 Tax=Microvirga sesbaniae TaxID=681392 RepID=UPI0021C71BA3|nr:hypothetical protein [Microvirga sp. HBU67692]